MTTAFTYTEYDQDFFSRVLRDYGDKIPPDFRTLMNQYAITQQGRDEDLEGYLAQGTFAPGLGVSFSGTTAFTSGAETPVTFTVQDYQSTSILTWDGSTKITTASSGVMMVAGYTKWAAENPASGTRASLVYQNGVETLGVQLPAYTGATMRCPVVDVVTCLAGDYFQVAGFQDQGAPSNLLVAKMRVVLLGASG